MPELQLVRQSSSSESTGNNPIKALYNAWDSFTRKYSYRPVDGDSFYIDIKPSNDSIDEIFLAENTAYKIRRYFLRNVSDYSVHVDDEKQGHIRLKFSPVFFERDIASRYLEPILERVFDER